MCRGFPYEPAWPMDLGLESKVYWQDTGKASMYIPR